MSNYLPCFKGSHYISIRKCDDGFTNMCMRRGPGPMYVYVCFDKNISPTYPICLWIVFEIPRVFPIPGSLFFYVTRNKILKLATMDQWCYLAHDAGLAYIELCYSKLLIYYLETQYIYIYIYIYIYMSVCVLWCGVCVFVCVRGSKLSGQYWKLTHSKLKWRNLRENVMMKRDVESANHVSID